MVEKKVLLG